MLDLNSRVVVREDLLSVEADGALVVYDPVEGAYYDLNAVASRLWREMSAPVVIADLCSRLCVDYNAPEQVIRQDVLAHLTRLLDAGLLRIE